MHRQRTSLPILNSSSLSKLCSHLIHFRTSTNSNLSHLHPSKPNSPINPSSLLRVCTVLYQQQNTTEPKLISHLHKCDFDLSHEFFIQVCNKFPYSWKPVYNFFKFTKTQPSFIHTSITFNKMVDIYGKAKNMELLWELLQEMANRRLVNDQTFRIALKSFASGRELKKCVEFFHLMNTHDFVYSLGTLNKVVETLYDSKLVDEAKYVVWRLKEWIKPSGVTYKYLIFGFCEVGELIEASKVWNLMVDEGFKPEVDAIEKMMESFFKSDKYGEAMKLFQVIDGDVGLSTYRLVIIWMCKKEKLAQAQFMFEGMLKRGIQPDSETIGALVYGLLTKRRVREAYMLVEKIERPDISVYHGLIKGFLKLRRSSEATQVFREMIKRGCEPTMHTYIMLLQGHLGKRGRKGLDPIVNFESIFVGGLVKLGKSLEATKYVERMISGGVEVPRFDYNKFLHDFSNEEGIVLFEEVGKRLNEVGLVDLSDIFIRYGEKMTTRERRRRRRLDDADGHSLHQNILME